MTRTAAPRYDHRQLGRLQFMLWFTGVLFLVGAFLLRATEPAPAAVLAVSGAIQLLLPIAFSTLRVRDDGDALLLRYGPLPLVSRRLPYAEMVAVKRGRSNLLDGFILAYGPGRGWIWNLWGFGCVRVQTVTGVLRIGTDDPEGLAAFLGTRIIDEGAQRPSASTGLVPGAIA